MSNFGTSAANSGCPMLSLGASEFSTETPKPRLGPSEMNSEVAFTEKNAPRDRYLALFCLAPRERQSRPGRAEMDEISLI